MSAPNPQIQVVQIETGPAALSGLARHWGLFFTFGLVSVALGIAMMVWPHATVAVVAILLGAWLIVSGVFSLVSSFGPAVGGDTGARVLLGISGALSILLGVMAFRGIFQAVEILALFVGIGWLMRGVFEVVSGLQSTGQPGRGWTITIGALSVVAGIVVLAWPSPTLLVIAWVGGVWLVVLGILEIVNALSLRRLAKRF